MKERGILFNGAMVRAILAGTKTQTRRAGKPVRHPDLGNWYDIGALLLEHEPQHVIERACPYGQPGDRLWVRETTVKVEEHGYVGPVYVESDEGRAALEGGLAPDPDDCTEVEPYELRLRPSIHMPRRMARILLEIVSVRIERLQDISEADAEAEGIDYLRQIPDADETLNARELFQCLWTSINGDDSWDANPFVWVIEFKRVEG